MKHYLRIGLSALLCLTLLTGCEGKQPPASVPSTSGTPAFSGGAPTEPDTSAGETTPERVWTWGSEDVFSDVPEGDFAEWENRLEDWAQRYDIHFAFPEEELSAACLAAQAELDAWANEPWVISFQAGDVSINRTETLHAWYMYFEYYPEESRLFTDWTKEDMETRMLAVDVRYICEYDGTKTFLPDGDRSATFYMVKEGDTWEYWDMSNSYDN